MRFTPSLAITRFLLLTPNHHPGRTRACDQAEPSHKQDKHHESVEEAGRPKINVHVGTAFLDRMDRESNWELFGKPL